MPLLLLPLLPLLFPTFLEVLAAAAATSATATAKKSKKVGNATTTTAAKKVGNATTATAAKKVGNAATATAKKSKQIGNAKKTASTEDRQSYAKMVTTAILEQKERTGSSLGSIKKFIHQNFALVPTAATSRLIGRAVKKLQEAGRIIPGAPAGRKGSGCFKLGPEEKTRIVKDVKLKAKKAKIQVISSSY